MAKIVIDPGHGGTKKVGGSSPNNATGPTGLKEKKVTLSIGKLCGVELKKRGHTVALTRTSDKNLGLAARAGVARKLQADAFVSIHFNGWKTPNVQGTETWLHSNHSPESDALAKAVQKHLVKATGLRNRGVKSKDLGVLRPNHHAARTAACLTEVSFLTDPKEEKRPKTKQYRRRVAVALADGIEQYVAFSALVAASELLEEDVSILSAAEDGIETALAAVDVTRLRQIIRAVSWVESKHGTAGQNQPRRDPMQRGNPNDKWWKELTGQSGKGSRFVRGPGMTPNHWAQELPVAAAGVGGFPDGAKVSVLGDKKKGHVDEKFTKLHSFNWGIAYLLHRINTRAGRKTYQCGGLARSDLVRGAVAYNGGGDPNYEMKIEAALTLIGDIT